MNKCKFDKLPLGSFHMKVKDFLSFIKTFDTKDSRRAQRILEISSLENYVNRTRCPYCSGRRLRVCHGPLIDKLLKRQAAAEFSAE